MNWLKKTSQIADFPPDLENDLDILHDEQQWMKSLKTPGSLVKHDTLGWIGTVKKIYGNPFGGDGKVLVEHPLSPDDNRLVERFYSAYELSPAMQIVSPFRRASNSSLKIGETIPQVFRVAIDFNEDTAPQLSNRILNGIVGISDSQTLAIQWFNVARNGMLMMPGTETLAQNNLFRVDYGNSEQMMQNNMAMMRRIFNQRKASDVIHRLFEYCVVYAKRMNKKEYADFVYFMTYTAFWQPLSYLSNEQNINVNTIDELAEWASKVAPDLAASRQGDWGRRLMTLTPQMWVTLIRGAINEIGQVYQDEGEWIVQDSNLHIPFGSTLYIVLPTIHEEHMKMLDDPQKKGVLKFLGVQDQLDKIENMKGLVTRYGLERIYRIRYVDDKSFSDAKSDYFKRRSS